MSFLTLREAATRACEAEFTSERLKAMDDLRDVLGRIPCASMKVYEYPTRGLRDDLRQYIALRIAPWLLP